MNRHWKNYHKVHARLKRYYGKADHCDNPKCPTIKASRFEWALKKGKEYSDNPKDYFQFCPSCHRKYDYKPEMRENIIAKLKGRLLHTRLRPVRRISPDGTVVVYKSIAEATRENNIKYLTSIANCLSGKANFGYGYKWEYHTE